MLSLVNLKKQRDSVNELQNIVSVLKNFSVMQLRLLQQKKKETAYSEKLERIFRIINLEYIVHPFLKERPGLPKVVVILTSDEGFTGELNTLLLEAAELRLKPEDRLIVLGEKGVNLLRSQDRVFIRFERQKDKELTYTDARNLTQELAAAYMEGKIGRVDFIYPRFISLTKQIVVGLNLLPFYPQRVIKEESRPEAASQQVIIEPNLPFVVDILVKLWLTQRIYNIFSQARLAHTAARVLQLEGSLQELDERGKRLRRRYFKLLHSINDNKLHETLASRICG